jgi:hypothetical protein
MSDQRGYWFPAKKRGWGWGWPRHPAGQLVLIAFFLLVLAGAPVLLPGRSPLVYLAWCLFLNLILVLICWWKGEPPGQR